MRTIYKIAFPVTVELSFALPKGAIPLHVGRDTRDQDKIAAWFFVDDDQPDRFRKIHVVGTGRPVPAEVQPGDYIGSVISEFGFIWHLFLEPEA